MAATTCSPPNSCWASCPADGRQRLRAIDAETGFARLVNFGKVTLRRWLRLCGGRAAGLRQGGDRSAAVSSHAQPDPLNVASAGLWSSLAFWRGLAAAAIAALAIYIAVPYVSPPVDRRSAWSPRWPPTAAMSNISSSTTPARRCRPFAVSGERAAGKDFELWMIEGKNAPVSMGVIPGRPVSTYSSPAVHRSSRKAPCSPSASSRRAVRRPASRPDRLLPRAI